MPGFDRISELPESLLTHILSFLPTKHSVKTSVLSTRWKNLWLNVRGLDLNTNDFFFQEDKVFLNFIDRFLKFHPKSSLQKLKVDFSREEIIGIKNRISTAISHEIKHLDLVSNTFYRETNAQLYPCIEFVPRDLYTNRTLVSLKLTSSGLKDTGFVHMPCLKFMQLVDVQWCGTMNPEKLILGCPVLEELTLVRVLRDELVVTRLRSRSLKKVCVVHEHFSTSSDVVSTIEIDAPGLEYMSLTEDLFDRIVVKNLSSLLTVDLAVRFLVDDFRMLFDAVDLSMRNEIRDFLTGISSVRHMIISCETVKALCRYSMVIPKFNNLSRVQAELETHLLDFLPTFLESCPNLKHLSLKFVKSKSKMIVFELVDVPRCVLSTLESVEIKGIFYWEDKESQLAIYFLENAAVLKKLVVSLLINPKRRVSDSEIYKELNKITKRSQRCEIILDCESCVMQS